MAAPDAPSPLPFLPDSPEAFPALPGFQWDGDPHHRGRIFLIREKGILIVASECLAGLDARNSQLAVMALSATHLMGRTRNCGGSATRYPHLHEDQSCLARRTRGQLSRRETKTALPGCPERAVWLMAGRCFLLLLLLELVLEGFETPLQHRIVGLGQ